MLPYMLRIVTYDPHTPTRIPILTLGDTTSGAQARSPSSCMGIMYKSQGTPPSPIHIMASFRIPMGFWIFTLLGIVLVLVVTDLSQAWGPRRPAGAGAEGMTAAEPTTITIVPTLPAKLLPKPPITIPERMVKPVFPRAITPAPIIQ